MDIKHYYYYKKCIRIRNFLDKYDIPYTEDKIGNEEIYLFNFLESDAVYKRFKKLYPLAWNRGYKVLYSKQEIEDAQWLIVKNSTEKIIADICYEDDCFELSCPYLKHFPRRICYKHHNQIDSINIEKIKTLKNRFFCGIDWGNQNYLFCSEEAKSLLQNRWNGLEFWNIKKRTTKENVKGIYQMFFKNPIPLEAVVFDDYGKMKICSGCGKKYIYTNKTYFQIKLKKEYMCNLKNVYSTGNIFSDGLNDYEIHIVPHEFYKICEENGMNKGMIYEPIILV